MTALRRPLSVKGFGNIESNEMWFVLKFQQRVAVWVKKVTPGVNNLC